MICDSENHHRRSMRLQGYDYACSGAYFVTICTQSRVCLFGEIIDDKVVLNDAGMMVQQAFKSITTHEYINGVKQFGWPPFSGIVWQRNYWEHIVGDEPDLNRWREYIRLNPEKWALDTLMVAH